MELALLQIPVNASLINGLELNVRPKFVQQDMLISTMNALSHASKFLPMIPVFAQDMVHA
jgi:hypothetical protein